MKKATVSLASLVLSIFALSLQLRADSVLTTIPVGNGATGIAANPKTNKIYVGGSGQVVVIDGKTQQVTDRITIDTGINASFVAVNALTNRIYASACNSGACKIAVIDGRNDKVITDIPIASGDAIGLQGLAVNPVTNRIYASDADNQQYIAIDGQTNTIITQVFVDSQPGGIAVNPKTNRIYIAGTGFPALIMVFDGTTNTEVASIQEDFGLENVAVNFRLDRAYVTDQDKVIVVDGATNQEAARVPAGPFANGVDVNLLNNKVYVANSNGASVTIIDGNTNQVLQTLPVPDNFPSAVAVDLANGFTYVAGSNQAIVLQPN